MSGLLDPGFLVVDLKSLEKVKSLLNSKKSKLSRNCRKIRENFKNTRVLLVQSIEKQIVLYDIEHLRKRMNICGLIPMEINQEMFNTFFNTIINVEGKMLLIA